MATISIQSRDMIETMVRSNGHFEDDEPALEISVFLGPGGYSFHLAYSEADMLNRDTSTAVRRCVILYRAKTITTAGKQFLAGATPEELCTIFG